MRNRISMACLLAAGLSLPASQASAQTCDTTFAPSSGNSGSWQKAANWDPAGRPGRSDVACVPSGKTATVWPKVCAGGTSVGEACQTDGNCPSSTCVEDPDVYAKAVVIDGDVVVTSTTSLTISHDSTIDGEIDLGYTSSLAIADDLTITGEGGIMDGESTADGITICELANPSIDASKVCSGGTNAGLSCDDAGDCPSGSCVTSSPTLTIQGVGGTEATSIQLIGRWTTNVPIINNGFVESDNWESSLHPLDCGFIVAADGNGGSGTWTTSNNAILTIDGSVSGASTWYPHVGKIVISAACTSLTGDVTITQGTLVVDEDFSTTGDLASTGTITVKSGKKAMFSW